MVSSWCVVNRSWLARMRRMCWCCMVITGRSITIVSMWDRVVDLRRLLRLSVVEGCMVLYVIR